MNSEGPNFLAKSREGSNKRYKTSGSSSFNIESGEASINLNVDVGDDEEDEVQEIRRPISRDKTKGSMKKKGSRSSGSSSTNDEALARLMVSELAMHNERAIEMQKEEHKAFLEIKKREPYDHLTGDALTHMEALRKHRYWQEPNPHESPVEQVATSRKKTKKSTRARQKRTIQSDDAPWQIAWTTEEEIVLAKGWVAISENNKHGKARKQDGFWCEVLQYIERKQNSTVVELETGLLFKFRHCWEVLKDSPKWQEIALPKFTIESSGGSKRHKSTGSSSFNTESGDASINLNTNVGDNDEDEVQNIRRSGGRDKARAAGKNKGSKASGSSTMNDDALARLMVNEMTAQEKEQREKNLEIKRMEVKCREREVVAQEYRQEQEDIRFCL
ncbi:ALP1-like protein [Tanacetum coccineum]